MEPTELTCAKCGQSWKLIKAGTRPVTCPHCKAPLAAGPSEIKPEPPPAVQAPAETGPAVTASDSVLDPPALPKLTPVAVANTADTDDPGFKEDYDDRVERRGRPGSNPLVRVVLILLLLFIGVPLAIFILLLVVCALISVA